MTKSIEQIKIKLKCPGCGKEIQEVWKARLDSVIGVRYAYICIECNKLISIKNEIESSKFNHISIETI
jgi:DNA-directed RNA polymerase subunit RPC12/RpoP